VGALGLAARKANPMTAALSIANLRKSFGGLPAMDGVSMEIPAGERRLIIGPNGAGKTTLFNLISGDLRADSGSVRLFGDEVGSLRPDQRAQRGVGRTYQIITLFPKNTIAENVILAMLGLTPSRWQPLLPLARRTDLRDRAREVLARVGLEAVADRPLAAASYGEKRRAEIAMALAQDPRLLLLDEPLAGLSMEERKSVQALLETIPRDVTIVMIEHDIDAALAFAERITVLHYGTVIVEGTRAEVVAHPRTREVYLGS
jgi:branched-chain amino acid transport system ATP-binding protein